MLNDRNDKHEGQEESEYHFSDEEVSYELEPETPKQQPPGGGGGDDAKTRIMKKLSENKRILISAVVVVALIFVFYKFLSPSVPSTDINAVPAVAQNTSAMNPAASINKPASMANAAQPAAPQFVTATTNQPIVSAPVTNQQPAAPAVVAQAPVIPSAPSVPAVANMPNNQQVAITAPQQMQPQQNQPYPAQMQPQQAMPAVVTVQSAPYQTAAMPVQAYPGQMPGNLPPNYEMVANGLNNQSNTAANQVQAEYVQKLNDFAVQNKMLQNQVQTLNSRVSSLETELTQLTRVLMRQYQSQSQNANQPNPAAYPNNGAPVPAQMSSQQAEPKSLYNVQAIIPGRAWLRAENGETVTVAEGDQIKDLGRVSKIDPYDGVVEINTGTKVISLAYGNGG
jgi:hypothetical protein